MILVYDIEMRVNFEIEFDDVDYFLVVLCVNEGFCVFEFNSSGGSVWVGCEMVWIVIDFGLDIIVYGECVSFCVCVFLVG